MDKLKNGNEPIFEDILENVFIAVSLGYLLDSKRPNIDQIIIIASVTIIYWFLIYKFFIPLYYK